MALDPSYFFYSEGTISLTNGSDIATGTFTAWDPAVLPFDFVYPNDGMAGMSVIKEVLAMDEIRLAKPWTGPTLTDVPYFMVRWTRHTDPRIYALRVSDYLTRLKGIPENLDEVAQQIGEDAATAASALTTITQAASDVEADRQAAAGSASAAAGSATTATQQATAATAEANRAASYVPSGVAKSISGLVPFNDATAPTTTLGVSPGSARDKNNSVDIVLAAAMRKRINAVWAAGDGNGGLDTGAAATGYYHVYVIRNPTTSAVDILFSTSPTAPTMPSGFTQRRRIGMFLYFGGIVGGLWRADGSFEFKVPFQVATDAPLNGNVLQTVLNPSGIKVKWKGTILGYNASAGFHLIARDPDVGPPPSSSADPNLALMSVFYKVVGSAYASVPLEVWTDTSGRIYLNSAPTSASNLVSIFTQGFTDLRDEFI